MSMQEETSIKEILKNMVPEAMEIVQGKVISSSPLLIQVVNDEKLVLNENTICLPRHLCDHTIKIDIELSGGSIYSHTFTDGQHPHGQSGEHPHGTSGEHAGHEGGDGAHSHPSAEGTHGHPDSEGAHVNWLQDFNIYGATIKLYNALKYGETVYMLSFNHGKKYYVLDREV